MTLPGTWDTMTCVVEILRPDGKWDAIPSEVSPPDIRMVLESQIVLDLSEGTNEDFARRLRSEVGACTVVQMHRKPGYQCLSWSKGNRIVLPPLAFPRTHILKDFPMLARYHLEEWQRIKHLHMTEKDWPSFANPICTSRLSWMHGGGPLMVKSTGRHGTGGTRPALTCRPTLLAS